MIVHKTDENDFYKSIVYIFTLPIPRRIIKKKVSTCIFKEKVEGAMKIRLATSQSMPF